MAWQGMVAEIEFSLYSYGFMDNFRSLIGRKSSGEFQNMAPLRFQDCLFELRGAMASRNSKIPNKRFSISSEGWPKDLNEYSAFWGIVEAGYIERARKIMKTRTIRWVLIRASNMYFVLQLRWGVKKEGSTLLKLYQDEMVSDLTKLIEMFGKDRYGANELNRRTDSSIRFFPNAKGAHPFWKIGAEPKREPPQKVSDEELTGMVNSWKHSSGGGRSLDDEEPEGPPSERPTDIHGISLWYPEKNMRSAG